VHWALAEADKQDASIEVIDLRTLAPLDTETVFASARKTGRIWVRHEDTLSGGFGGELAALITENCFTSLDAPVMRCASMDTPVPFVGSLEEQFLANGMLSEKMTSLLDY
jgi:2-oxoisovalerate dehydrogenase E1 component